MIQALDEALVAAFELYFDLQGDVIYSPEDVALRRYTELKKASQVTMPFMSICKQGDIDVDTNRLGALTFHGMSMRPGDPALAIRKQAIPVTIPYEAIYWAPLEMYAANNFVQRAIWLRALPFVLEVAAPNFEGEGDSLLRIQNRLDSAVRIEPANTESEFYQKGKYRRVRFTWVCEGWVFDTSIFKSINRFTVSYGSSPNGLYSGTLDPEAIIFDVQTLGEP